MEDIPPSYYQSTNPSVLDLIAPYLGTKSLHALTLVSRSYNETFMPHLWGSPASHFVPMAGPTSPGIPRGSKAESSYDDMVYVALTRFKRILRIARPSTRRLVHTLYLPAAASEIYSGPNATWLREILDGLPNLQSLCVSGLPFFDHHSLVAVEKHRPSLPNDGYQVLKLRGVGLRDPEAEVLAHAIGLRVRLLDLAENFLGDTAVRSLLQTCFVRPNGNATDAQNANGQNDIAQSPTDYHSRRHLESWPVGLPPAPDFLSLDTLRSADFDKNLLVQLTNPLTGRLAFEDIPHSGLTHLYINGNPAITIDAVKSLLAIGRLHVLNAGDIAEETAVDKYVSSVRGSIKRHGRTKSIGSGTPSVSGSRLSGGRTDTEADEYLLSDDDSFFTGAEKLIPVLREKASKNLTYLRIEHSIVTKEYDVAQEQEKQTKDKPELAADGSFASELSVKSNDDVLVEAPGSRRLAVEAPASNHHPVELALSPDVFELDATPANRAELLGDIIHIAISPPIGDKPEADSTDNTVVSPIRGEGPFAPEVVENGKASDEDEEKIVLDATGLGITRRPTLPLSISPSMQPADANHNASIDSVIKPIRTAATNLPPSPSQNHQTTIQNLTKLRPGPISTILHPSSLPNLRTLILTHVPAQVAGPSSPIIKSIKSFIMSCATEAYIAILKARTNYSLPPGRARAAAERKHALSLFALRTIVLEVHPIRDDSQRDWKHTRQRLNISKSSTGDHDSEALWSAAENDFSFFGEEGEEHDECGIYEHEPGKYFPSIHLDDKFAITADDISSPTSVHSPSSNLSLNSPTGTVFRSPRELPLGRNRRPSNETRGTESTSLSHRLSIGEMPGSTPTSQPRSQPSSSTAKKAAEQLQMVDVVAELSKWRKERKTAFDDEVRRRSRVNGVTVSSRLADVEVYVEGYWKGEIKVVRNTKPIGSGVNRGQGRLERTGMVDVYGNYFEKGYLYS